MRVLLTCLSLHYKRNLWSPETKFMESYELSYGCWESNVGTREELPVLTAEPSLAQGNRIPLEIHLWQQVLLKHWLYT